MRNLDFSSWQGILTTLFGLVVITLIGVGIRMLVMQTIQQRRERENRQINERLRTLIAAYKTLGGSFTGDLAVDPTHLRDLKSKAAETGAIDAAEGNDRARRTRDAVEAALSDIILLGTEEQVRLATKAAADLVAGRATHTDELVISLRDFIRKVLDLDPISAELSIPKQGPARAVASKGGGKGDGEKGGGGKGGGMGGMGGGAMGAGMGMGIGGGLALDDDARHS
ncbi:MAG: hypothetical protein QM761_05805 [Pseudoxanthomonas sp.]